LFNPAAQLFEPPDEDLDVRHQFFPSGRSGHCGGSPDTPPIRHRPAGAQPGVRRDDLLQQVALANQPVEPDGSRHCAGSNCDMAPTARA
jgi:hypothetical protein